MADGYEPKRVTRDGRPSTEFQRAKTQEMEDQASSRIKSGIFEAKLETGDYDRGTVLEIMMKAMDARGVMPSPGLFMVAIHGCKLNSTWA